MIIADLQISPKWCSPSLLGVHVNLLTNLIYVSDGPGDPSAPISPVRTRKGKFVTFNFNEVTHTNCLRT